MLSKSHLHIGQFRTDFRDKNDALAWILLKNLSGIPDTIFYGGIGEGYDDFNWKEYQFEERIRPYYGGKASDEQEPFGEVTIWKRK